MRSEEEVASKSKEIYHKHLRERQAKYLSVCHLNCNWNKRHRVKGNNEVGFCQNTQILAKAKNDIFICNEAETAQQCLCFECKHTEESVKNDFDEIIKNPAHCGQEYPKLAVLIWILQKEAKQSSRKERLKQVSGELLDMLMNLLMFKWW